MRSKQDPVYSSKLGTTAALSGRGEAVSYREEAILPSLLSSKTLKTTYNQQ